MAGTDNTHCAMCGEGFYDKADRVGDLCPNCWELRQVEQKAAEIQQELDQAREEVEARRADLREREKEAKAGARETPREKAAAAHTA